MKIKSKRLTQGRRLGWKPWVLTALLMFLVVWIYSELERREAIEPEPNAPLVDPQGKKLPSLLEPDPNLDPEKARSNQDSGPPQNGVGLPPEGLETEPVPEEPKEEVVVEWVEPEPTEDWEAKVVKLPQPLPTPIRPFDYLVRPIRYPSSIQKTVIELLGGLELYQKDDRPDPRVYRKALKTAKKLGISESKIETLAVANFKKPSYLRRLTIYDRLAKRAHQFLVSHGGKSGSLYAERFSNVVGSNMSSLGLYRVGEIYQGRHGTALKLKGLQRGLNHHAARRAIVIHGAWYVSYDTILENFNEGLSPRIGRSQGCPAVEEHLMAEVAWRLKPGSYLYIEGEPL